MHVNVQNVAELTAYIHWLPISVFFYLFISNVGFCQSEASRCVHVCVCGQLWYCDQFAIDVIIFVDLFMRVCFFSSVQSNAKVAVRHVVILHHAIASIGITVSRPLLLMHSNVGFAFFHRNRFQNNGTFFSATLFSRLYHYHAPQIEP